MIKPKAKSKIIEQLIKQCRAEPSKVFDDLNEKSNAYLEKLLKLANAL